VSAAEEQPADEPADEPGGEEPVPEAAVEEQPAADEAAAEPAVEEPPAATEPAVEEPAADEPAAEPAAEVPIAEEPAVEPVVEEPAAEPAVEEQPAADEPATEAPEPATERVEGTEPAVDSYAAEQAARSVDFKEGVGVKFMVGVDGSNVSMQAFKAAVHMLQKGDMLLVYHCSNPGRYKEMAPAFQPDCIKGAFESEAIKADICFNHRIDYVFETKQSPTDKIRTKILTYAHKNKVDVLVLGSYGSKSRESEDEGVEYVGTSAIEAVQNAHCTTVLVKNTTNVPDYKDATPASFLVGVDGSDIAHQGFLQAAHLCQRKDRLVTLTLGETIPTRSSKVPLCFRPEIIQERYTEELQLLGYGQEAVLERCPSGMSIASKFIKNAEERDISFLVFGSVGLSGRQAQLGSVAKRCVEKAKCGVIVVKLSSRDLRPAESLEHKGVQS